MPDSDISVIMTVLHATKHKPTMAKLSATQKAENQAASRVRDQAYRDRLRAYAAQEREAQALLALSAERKAATAADEALDSVRRACNVRQAEIRQQIAALSTALLEVEQQSALDVAPLQRARKEAWAALNARRGEMAAALEARFPDLKGVWSSAQWKKELVPAG